MPKRYVIKVHYSRRRPDQPWTVHYRGQCLPAAEVQFRCWAKTLFKPESRSNPRAFIQAYGNVSEAKQGVLVIQ